MSKPTLTPARAEKIHKEIVRNKSLEYKLKLWLSFWEFAKTINPKGFEMTSRADRTKDLKQFLTKYHW